MLDFISCKVAARNYCYIIVALLLLKFFRIHEPFIKYIPKLYIVRYIYILCKYVGTDTMYTIHVDSLNELNYSLRLCGCCFLYDNINKRVFAMLCDMCGHIYVCVALAL